MFRALLLSMVLIPTFAMAGLFTCEQQQQMCKAACEVTNVGNEKGLSTCNAKCLGKRVSCSLEKGKEKLKESTESLKAETADDRVSLKETVEAFWEGLSGKPAGSK